MASPEQARDDGAVVEPQQGPDGAVVEAVRRRVLFLATRVEPDRGVSGASAHAAASLAALRRRFDVAAVFADSGRPGVERSGPTHVRRLVPARVRGLRQDLRLLSGSGTATRRAVDEGRRFGASVVYERNEYLSLVGRQVARRLGIPLVLEVNGVLELDMRVFYRSLAEPLGRVLERRKYRIADAIVTTSETLARELVARGARAERVHVVPYAVRPELLEPAGRRPSASGDIVVGWLGHGLPWHGLDLLADAAALLAEDPQVVFRVVGGGPAVDQLRDRVASSPLDARFSFRKAVPAADVRQALAEFDIGVVPQNPTDRFPIKLLEMGAAGLPVAAPTMPCILDLLTPGEHFEPFEPGSPSDLARALRVLAHDPQRRASLGSSLRDHVAGQFAVDMAADRLHAVVESVSPRDGRSQEAV